MMWFSMRTEKKNSQTKGRFRTRHSCNGSGFIELMRRLWSCTTNSKHRTQKKKKKKNIHKFDLDNQETEQSFSCALVSCRTHRGDLNYLTTSFSEGNSSPGASTALCDCLSFRELSLVPPPHLLLLLLLLLLLSVGREGSCYSGM